MIPHYTRLRSIMQTRDTTSKKRREPSIQDSDDDDQSSMGRWTRDEHNKFVDGLRKYGKNWKLIEDYVNTRSGSQIRSHAQKFFSRLEKQCNISKGEIFKYLDKISNDLLEFNSENEMLRKRKIWEVIKASNIENCSNVYNSVDSAAVEDRLEKLTRNLEVVMHGLSTIPDTSKRDHQLQSWRDIVKGVVEMARDFSHELERDSSIPLIRCGHLPKQLLQKVHHRSQHQTAWPRV